MRAFSPSAALSSGSGLVLSSVSPLSGVSGSIITISGSGFLPNPLHMCVFLGGQGAAGKVINTSPTQIQCQIGPVNAPKVGNVSVICGPGHTLPDTVITVGASSYALTGATVLEANAQADANVNFQLLAANANNDGAVYTAPNLDVTLTGGAIAGKKVTVDLHLECGAGKWLEIVFCITPQQNDNANDLAAAVAATINLLYPQATATAAGAKVSVTKAGITGGHGSIQR